MVIGLRSFLVGLLVLFACRFRRFVQVCFFQFFSEKNLKNFGRGFLKMVIGFEEFLVGLLVLFACRFPTGLLLPIFFRKKFKKFWQRLFENGYWF